MPVPRTGFDAMQFSWFGETTMSDSMNRRRLLGITAVTGLSSGLASEVAGAQAGRNGDSRGSETSPRSRPARLILTEASNFVDVSRGNPKPSRSLANPASFHPDQIVVTAPAGSVLVFNGHLWHAGTCNRSNGHRRVLQCSFHGGELTPGPPPESL